ncbi:hypothetical protein EYZ11_008632 [Aspergillus tanneri]|uniref:Uncharacterized protein n=1 Tax=Aspergillus tanneri TaxID=1220188 RepID=A0A4S3JAA9_9EURO|nr:hypothetical protein EYZ11_008632 [Aspergillus tanneri]
MPVLGYGWEYTSRLIGEVFKYSDRRNPLFAEASHIPQERPKSDETAGCHPNPYFHMRPDGIKDRFVCNNIHQFTKRGTAGCERAHDIKPSLYWYMDGGEEEQTEDARHVPDIVKRFQ